MPSPEDATRFSSTEAYYASHRPGYGEEAIEYLVERYALDERARVLDLGCGAGQLTVPLSARAGEVVGMDPDEAMLEEARDRAAAAGRENVEWVVGSDADLSGEMGPFRLTTMGRSFHWMDQRATLERLRAMTEPGGGVAILNDPEWLTRGRRKWQTDAHAIADRYLDDIPDRKVDDEEEYDDPWDELIAEFGFDVAVRTFEVEREWTVDGVVGYVFSLSFCSPDEFGDAMDAFEADLRDRLDELGGEPFRQEAEVTVIAGRT